MGLLAILMATALQAGAEGDVKAGVDAWRRGDHAAAVAAWRPLAERGDAHAQFNLAQAYKLGRGAPADRARALDLYQRAAAQGHQEAGALLGLLLFQDGRREEAMPHIVTAAEAGEAGAQYVYGTALFNGDVVKQDLPRAYAMMKRAADAGVRPAALMLAEMDKLIPAAERGVALAQGAAPAGRNRVTAVPLVAKAVAAAPPAQARPSAAQPMDRWRVQLGAFGQPANADALFARLAAQVGVLGGTQPYLVRAGAVTRLQAGPFASRASAEGACRAVQAAGAACFAVAP